MILVDSNIPMYLVGAEHPNKHAARELLDHAVLSKQRLVTDAVVFQEILHRYHNIRRIDAIQPAFDVLLSVVDDVLPIDLDVAQRAKLILAGGYGLSARDAIHVSAMEGAGVGEIMSFDGDLDGYPGITRIS